MRNELTDLLPEERQHALSRGYLIRFVTVAALMLTALTLAAAVLLVPSYLFLVENEKAKEARLASIESTLPSDDERSLSERLAALSQNAATLAALEHRPSASAIVRGLLAVPHPGASVSRLSYLPASGKKSGTLAVSGAATTRDSLRAYQLALQGAPFALSADLPVSAYAKDSGISFVITVTLAP